MIKKKEKKGHIKNNKKKKGIYKSLKNNKREILLETKRYIFKLIWKDNASSYFCKIRRYNLLAIKKREIKHKKELKKSISYI